MSRAAWQSIVAAFVAGLALGWYWNRPATLAVVDSSRPASSDSNAIVLHDDDARDSFKLRQQIDLMRRNQASAALADRISFFEKYKTPYGNALGLHGFTEELHVTDEMVDYIQMNPSERKQVETHLKQISDEMKQLDRAHLQILKQDATGVTYQVEAFPEGKEVKAELASMLQQDLGDQRSDVLFSSGSYEMASTMTGFGEAPVQIQITRNAGAKPNEEPYEMLETRANGSMRGGIYGLPVRYQNLLTLPP